MGQMLARMQSKPFSTAGGAHTATALWESAWRVLQSMGFDSDCPEFIDGRGADLPGIVFQSMNLGCLSTYVGALYSFQPFL